MHSCNQALQVDVHFYIRQVENVRGHELIGNLLTLYTEHLVPISCVREDILRLFVICFFHKIIEIFSDLPEADGRAWGCGAG